MAEMTEQSIGTSTDARGSLTVNETQTIMAPQRQATEDLQAEFLEARQRNDDLDKMYCDLLEQIQKITMEAELERYRAVEDERSKWEARGE